MAQTPKILGQNLPDPAIDTTLFSVGIGNQVQFSVFVANQENVLDYITIALVPSEQLENTSRYIAYDTPLIGNGVLAFSGLFMNSGDRVQVRSQRGTTSFTATGMEYSA